MLMFNYNKNLAEEFKYGFDNSENHFRNGKTFFDV